MPPMQRSHARAPWSVRMFRGGPTMRPRVAVVAVLALVTPALAGCARPPAWGPPAHVVDLTHTLSPRFPYIPIHDLTFPIRVTPISDFSRDGVYANKWELTEHDGTHVDAPSHFAANARGLDELRADELIVPAVVIDFRARAAADVDATLGVAELADWERAHGRIPARAAVLLWTGWESRAGSEDAFVNAGPDGAMHFPGFGAQAVAFLARERSVSGIGTDTLSIDPGSDTRFTAHRALFAADRWAI